MNNYVYGIITSRGTHIDVSNSLLGAKQYATRHDYEKVSKRNDAHYHAQIVAIKTNGKWIKQ